MIKKIAQTRLWRLLHRFGLAPYIRKIYWGAKLYLIQNPMSQSIGNINAEFLIHDSHDYMRVNTFSQEQQIIARFVELIKTSDVVFDVGANTGIYSCFAAQKVDDGHLFAFEPEPTNAERLFANLERNATEWSVIEKALANSDGETKLSLSESSGEHSIKNGGDMTIRQNRAETLIQNDEVDSPDIVKIDVEGAELLVLEGFGDRLTDVRTILCEVHPDKLSTFGGSSEDIEEFLRAAGFGIEILDTGRSEYHILATK